MSVLVNGVPTELAYGAALDEAVAAYAQQTAGIAVALNGTVVPMRDWSATELRAGDRVEIVTAVQGG